MNLLVVDWDYFFPNNETGDISDDPAQRFLWDWTHQETRFYEEDIWYFRHAQFEANKVPIPMCSGYERFWDRFTFSENVEFFVAISNAFAAHETVALDVTNVVLFDAHHDSGYGVKDVDKIIDGGYYTCEDWMLLFWAMGAKRRVFYPKWKKSAMKVDKGFAIPPNRKFDHGKPFPEVFDRVFVCRSSAWVPPWCDEQFESFLSILSQSWTRLEPVTPRKFDIESGEAFERNENLLTVLKGTFTTGSR